MCLCPIEDHLGWQSGCPFNTKAEKETLSFGSSRRGCVRRRKRLGLKAGWVDETLDELFWPLLLLFYVKRTFHSKYCFYVGVGEGGVNFSVGNMWRERIPKGHFLLPLAVWCLVWKERISGCISTIATSSRGLMFLHAEQLLTRRNIRNQAAKLHALGETTIFSWSWRKGGVHLPNVVYR